MVMSGTVVPAAPAATEAQRDGKKKGMTFNHPPDILAKAIDALKLVKSGDTVLIASGHAAPQLLIDALVARAAELYDVEIIHLMHFGQAPYAAQEMSRHFRQNSFFTGANVRKAVSEGRADFTPIFLSEIPRLFLSGAKPIDVVLTTVSPPDRHGYCSLGTDCAVTLPAMRAARHVIAVSTPQMPRVHGENFFHISRIDHLIEYDCPLSELPRVAMTELTAKIGQYAASLIPDGATLQLGIGAIPDAVLHYLIEKNDLGMHTEMFSDGAVGLVKRGVITCKRKNFHKDKMIASFVLGTRELFDFVNSNPMVEFHPLDYVNDPFVIAQNDLMCAVNSAIEVDLTGQVCADSMGHTIFSGIGGQVDFIRGASRSKGGKPIIALPSTAKDDTISRIVFELEPGAGVVTSRGDAHYIVTEWGIAYLHGKTIRERAHALIKIAHPKFRDELEFQAKQVNLL
jgi:acetyl-CoA hydrolase